MVITKNAAGNEGVIPMSIEDFVREAPKAVYEACGEAYGVSVENLQTSAGVVPVVLVSVRGDVGPLVYSLSKLYLEYADRDGASLEETAGRVADDARWYAAELANEEDLEIKA